jgi:hypothetical protein
MIQNTLFMKNNNIKNNSFNFLIVINLIVLISSCIMFIIYTLDDGYPKDNWNYLGHHEFLIRDFFNSIFLFILMSALIVFISINLNNFIYYNYKVKIRVNELFNINLFYCFLLISYALALYGARYYGVDVLNRPEVLTGFYREFIYYSYRTIIPLSIVIIYPLVSLKLRRFILYIIPIYCWICDSRIPIFIFSLVLFIDFLFVDKDTKRFIKIIFLSFYMIILSHVISNHRGLIGIGDPGTSLLQQESIALKKNYEQTFISQTGFVVLRDLITTPLSRISSHVDFLLIDDWQIDEKQYGYLILNRFIGITLKKYNFSEEMKKLYNFDPGMGKMAAPGPNGIALAIFKSGLLGAALIVIFISGLVISINYVVCSFVSFFEYPSINENLIKSIIYIQWLWTSPRAAMVGLIYLYFIVLLLKYKNRFK